MLSLRKDLGLCGFASLLSYIHGGRFIRGSVERLARGLVGCFCRSDAAEKTSLSIEELRIQVFYSILSLLISSPLRVDPRSRDAIVPYPG